MSAIKQQSNRLAVEYRPTGEIRPSKHNSRLHSPDQIDRIAASIKANGWTKPIVVDEKGEILAGHGAHQAGLQLGEAEVPVVVVAGLTAAQKRAYRIADNKIAERSTWDTQILTVELGDLSKMGFDLDLTGFDRQEIDFLLQPPAANPTEPPVPDIEARAVSQPGDVWCMGDHRLICGDSEKAATYKALMQGRQAQCVFTDPPYGVSYGATTDTGHQVLQGDDKRRGLLRKMLTAAFAAAGKHTREDAGWYIWHASVTREDFATSMRDAGLIEQLNGYIIWEKPGSTNGWTDYKSAHEPCFYAAKQGIAPLFLGDRTNTTIWHLEHDGPAGEATSIGNGVVISAPDGQELYVTAAPPKGKKVRQLTIAKDRPVLLQARTDTDNVWRVGRGADTGTLHPTMKPVELARRAIINSTNPGDIVLDMFAGASSTIMAAEQTKRIGYAIELDPQYVDASVRRWQALTGKEAHHAEGQTFDSTAKDRHAKKAG